MKQMEQMEQKFFVQEALCVQAKNNYRSWLRNLTQRT